MHYGDLFNIVTVNIAGSAGHDPTKWPADDPSAIYALYVPPSTKVIDYGTTAMCDTDVRGLHGSGGVQGQIALIFECAPDPNVARDEATQNASHEIAESALDPYSNGWKGVDGNHIAWDIFNDFQDENADLCEMDPANYFIQSEPGLSFTFGAQRQWSNSAALAGHSPCAPYNATYFSTTLVTPEKITIDLSSRGGASSTNTNGVRIPPGTTRAFSVGFYSDGPHAPWTLYAVEGNPLDSQAVTGNLTVMSIDKASGSNGTVANVTVQVNSAGPYGSELLTIVSSEGGQRCDSSHPTEICHYTPVLIGGN
jgi:hypothetical protein